MTTLSHVHSPHSIDALSWAAQLHSHQRRKGKPVTHVSHLIAVDGLVWKDGGVSNRTVARAAAPSSCRQSPTDRSTLRSDTAMPFSLASSWRTTSALPLWARNNSLSQSYWPSSTPIRRGVP
ncbi:hypothetical protein BBFGKLBO_00538 [Synechococcus sp. CBW1107]|uniref:hypothetical protein n=1 Tax=Synechococcus sp. CBW1107 TaxID=2789857 RepID=UPI002AD227E5|nr:hypothetical protein [Synechococcus sp. CBW1107]CAK6689053.1 hypothetical protein BBFGKLBO_00538 [Synechococcus sp. CBW1107]